MAQRRTKAHKTGKTVKLKPADPFELIRWLARSQSDPRKAVAELVQNSLDAGATQIVLERVRLKRALSLRIRDDGEGVLPAMAREEALTHIATHIGHSYKLGLDAAERHRRVMAGKYGVGLLGFWSIGKCLELRSRVAGSRLWALRMEEDSPRAAVEMMPLRTDAPDTYTEVVIAPVHPTAQKILGGRRLSDYLASELRGQILATGAQIVVHDRIARGTAQKRFVVAPRRFVGERLEVPDEIEVDGFAPVRVELYLARGSERAVVRLACAGTLVADDVTVVAALELDGEPWNGGELTGTLDFASFNIPPGSRRGVQPDAAAAAFRDAIAERLQPLVIAQLARLELERRVAADRNVVRELRRALRGLRKRLPQYDLPTVAGGTAGGSSSLGEGRDGEAMPTAEAAREQSEEASPPPPDTMPLFPPGPLAAVRITPQEVRVAPGAERRVRATAADAHGRRLDTEVTLEWRMPGGAALGLSIRGEGPRPALVASPTAPLGSQVALMVVATQGEVLASALAAVTVAEAEPLDGDSGIPEPHLVSDPDGRWRSRMPGERWEVNEAHADYVGVRDDARSRLRYLLSLLAKEIVLRTTGRYEASDVLESLVEVLAHAERNLRGR